MREDNYGQPELITKRNDQYINPHSQLQLQDWQANVDLKPILSIHATLQYVSKCTNKVEPQLAVFLDILNQILNKSQPEDPILTSAQKLLLNSIAE